MSDGDARRVTCKGCGTGFIARPRGPLPSYCGGGCKPKRVQRRAARSREVANCWTCGNVIVVGTRSNGRRRKFCNPTCNNNYKGLRDSYKKSHKQRDLVWPYGESEDPVIAKVNRLIPRNLPEQIRAEACQELVVALLSEEAAESEAALATECVARARRGYQYSSKMQLSIELPPPGAPDQISLKERLAETNAWLVA